MTFDPNDDGITHINIYSKGKTELGRFLTNFSRSPIDHELLGSYNSIEALWYELQIKFPHTKESDEEQYKLMKSHGFEAKKLGRELREKYGEKRVSGFESMIKDAINLKVINSKYFDEFTNSTLPFTHYYTYGDKVVDAGHKWLIDYFEEMRKYYKENP